jgi:hypothetical protein
MNKNLQILGIGLGFALVIVVLASKPNCNRGCKTLLEHVAEHVLTGLIEAALA